MDEFEKIRELTEDLSTRREPTFTTLYQQKEQKPEQPPQTEQRVTGSIEQNSIIEPENISSDLTEVVILPEPDLPVSSGTQQETESVTPIAPVSSSSQEKEEDPEIKIYDFSKPIEEEISFIPLEQDRQIEEKSFPSLKLHLILISVLFVVLGISLTGFFIFQAQEAESDEIETITATSEVVKELPENAGGIVIPDQDKLVYNRIRSDNVTTKVESLFPEPEKPVVPQILAIEQNTPEPKFVDVKEMKAVNPLEEVQEEKKEKVVAVQNKPQEKPVVKAVALAPVKQEEVLKPKKEVIELQPMTASKPEKPKENIKKEIWRVQLFASNSKPAVEKAWTAMRTKHVKLLSNMSYIIKKVEIPRKGDFYRLQVGQFPTREMAEGMCSKLKAKKQDCLPVK